MTADEAIASSRPAAGQAWDAAGYEKNAGFVATLGGEVLDLLAPRPGERILDLGCGDGTLTARLAASGAEVVGLEPDPRMAARARERGIDVIEQDAHDPFGTEDFDAVFSNAALHWMHDPFRVLANTRQALRRGGRLVAEQGGFGNVAAVRCAIAAAIEAAGYGIPAEVWDFPTPAAQSRRLETVALRVHQMILIPRPTPLPTGIAGWLATFADPYLTDVPASDRNAVLADAERRLLPCLCDETGAWTADYVRLRFAADAV